MKKTFLFYLFPILVFTGCKRTPDPGTPEVMDDRLHLELILESPDIVTPIGLTIDADDNLYVLESHTHTPARDYPGPKYDRIKLGRDTNQDSRPDDWMIYADSINDGMNIYWHAGTVYVVEKDSVIAYKDLNNDGRADTREVLVRMLSPGQVYDHAGLLGLVVGPDNWLYISRGNTGGTDLTFVGSDGKTFDSYGEGGNIMRCRLDGSDLQEIARGFWNPFDIKFTAEGHLMAVENDPDSRGPNKLLDIVPGGEYGYHSLYGGSGIHPYLSWNGELPGTLPYAAGIGEAPSGLIDASYSNFPAEYRGNILATIWEENSLINIPLTPYMSSVRGEASLLVKGDSSFHPVALAANSKGEIFISDWVVRTYPNHGYGKIWLLSSGDSKPLASAAPKKNKYLSMLDKSYEFAELKTLLETADRFQQATARYLLADDTYYEDLAALAAEHDPNLRMQALLTISAMNKQVEKSLLMRFLSDPEEDIRRMALIYIGKHLRSDFREDLADALKNGLITKNIFDTYLATIPQIQPQYVKQFKGRSEAQAKKIESTLPENFVLNILKDGSIHEEIRATALPYLENPAEHIYFLVSLFNTPSKSIKQGLLHLFMKMNSEAAAAEMIAVVLDNTENHEMRTLALVALGYQSSRYCEEVAGVIQQADEVLAEEAARYLVRCRGDNELVKAIEEQLEGKSEALKIWNQSGGKLDPERPETKEAWIDALTKEGHVLKGQMVFRTAKSQCQQCHMIDKWGGTFGPDLSNIGSSKSISQLITAVLEPSAEIAPEWQGWFVTDNEGRTHYGRQIDVGTNSAELMLADGAFVNFKQPQDYGVATSSLMPDGLELSLTHEELRDLVTFLHSLK